MVMDPVAFHIGQFEIRWYGILISVSIVLGVLLAWHITKRKNQNTDHLLNLTLFGIIASIIGARLYYVLFQWDYYRGHPIDIIATWKGGLAIHGGIIGGVLAIVIYSAVKKLKPWVWLDILAPALALGQAIGRWGNFFNQEAFGTPTDLPWGIYISPANRPLGYEAFERFHPTFLYESLLNLVLFGLLYFLITRQIKGWKWLKDGTIFLIYGILYSTYRFFIEGLRTDSLWLGTARAAQVVSVIVFVLFILILFFKVSSVLKPRTDQGKVSDKKGKEIKPPDKE
ncbi:MAG: prolipoprotein diacylglyceryl transferase [Actinobacteria bacterium]|nr:prolipoprotein diacylglyceryl transferase [Actinomycetota bacterium]